MARPSRSDRDADLEVVSEMDEQRRRDEPSEGIGGIVDEITGSWIFGDTLTRLVDAGERVMHAQQSALSAIGLPSGSQLESLALRVRTVFHRLEELEDDIDRIERRLAALETRQASAAPGSADPTREAPRSASPRPATRKSGKPEQKNKRKSPGNERK